MVAYLSEPWCLTVEKPHRAAILALGAWSSYPDVGLGSCLGHLVCLYIIAELRPMAPLYTVLCGGAAAFCL